jgi:SAM-dependent methyltransferase
MSLLSRPLPVLCLAAAAGLLGCAAPDDYRPGPEASAKPGINELFLAADLEADAFVERFEGESREVFHEREAIVAASGIAPAAVVADVGSGTGAFLGPLARAVGPRGRIYALDIAPGFVEHLAQRAESEGLVQVEARLCSENSIDLPRASVDVAFLCDVYHHFEFPRSSMGSIHHALREGGEVVIVDFERIPGVSREWILGHVRAGKDEVIAELDGFGFDLVEELELPGLVENWAARFRRR